MATSTVRYCGIRLQYLDGATWKTVGSLVQPQTPAMGLDAIDVTNTDSGENGVCFREQIPGAVILLESATFSFYFDPGDSEHQAVISLMRSRTIMSWRLYDTPNAKSIWQCIGFVANIEFDMEKDAAQTFDVTIEFSLAPTTYGG